MDEPTLNADIAELIENYRRRLDVKFAAIEVSQQKMLRSLDRTHGELAKIHAILAEMRQHLSRPEDR